MMSRRPVLKINSGSAWIWLAGLPTLSSDAVSSLEAQGIHSLDALLRRSNRSRSPYDVDPGHEFDGILDRPAAQMLLALRRAARPHTADRD